MLLYSIDVGIAKALCHDNFHKNDLTCSQIFYYKSRGGIGQTRTTSKERNSKLSLDVDVYK